MDHLISTYYNGEAQDGIPPARPSPSNADGFLAQEPHLRYSCQQRQNMHRSHIPRSSFATQEGSAATGRYRTQGRTSAPPTFGPRPVRRTSSGSDRAQEAYYELEQLLTRVLENCDKLKRQNCELKWDITVLHREYVYLTH